MDFTNPRFVIAELPRSINVSRFRISYTTCVTNPRAPIVSRSPVNFRISSRISIERRNSAHVLLPRIVKVTHCRFTAVALYTRDPQGSSDSLVPWRRPGVPRAVYSSIEHGQSYTVNRSPPPRNGISTVSKIFFRRVDETFSGRTENTLLAGSQRSDASKPESQDVASWRRIVVSFAKSRKLGKTRRESGCSIGSCTWLQYRTHRDALSSEWALLRFPRSGETFLGRERWQTKSRTLSVRKQTGCFSAGIRKRESRRNLG